MREMPGSDGPTWLDGMDIDDQSPPEPCFDGRTVSSISSEILARLPTPVRAGTNSRSCDDAKSNPDAVRCHNNDDQMDLEMLTFTSVSSISTIIPASETTFDAERPVSSLGCLTVPSASSTSRLPECRCNYESQRCNYESQKNPCKSGDATDQGALNMDEFGLMAKLSELRQQEPFGDVSSVDDSALSTAPLADPVGGKPMSMGELLVFDESRQSMRPLSVLLFSTGFYTVSRDAGTVHAFAWSPFCIICEATQKVHCDGQGSQSSDIPAFALSIPSKNQRFVFASPDMDARRRRWMSDMSRSLRSFITSLFPSCPACLHFFDPPAGGMGRIIAGYLLVDDRNGAAPLRYCELQIHTASSAFLGMYDSEKCQLCLGAAAINGDTRIHVTDGIDCSCFSVGDSSFCAQSVHDRQIWVQALLCIQMCLQNDALPESVEEMQSLRAAILNRRAMPVSASTGGGVIPLRQERAAHKSMEVRQPLRENDDPSCFLNRMFPDNDNPVNTPIPDIGNGSPLDTPISELSQASWMEIQGPQYTQPDHNDQENAIPSNVIADGGNARKTLSLNKVIMALRDTDKHKRTDTRGWPQPHRKALRRAQDIGWKNVEVLFSV